jgi:hypothetical protein
MSSLLQPLRLLLMMFAGRINRHQLDLIDYLQEENRLLKERLGGRRPVPLRQLRQQIQTFVRSIPNPVIAP